MNHHHHPHCPPTTRRIFFYVLRRRTVRGVPRSNNTEQEATTKTRFVVDSKSTFFTVERHTIFSVHAVTDTDHDVMHTRDWLILEFLNGTSRNRNYFGPKTPLAQQEESAENFSCFDTQSFRRTVTVASKTRE